MEAVASSLRIQSVALVSLNAPVLRFLRTSRDPRADLIDATNNEGPYPRPFSQGHWMEEMRAHLRCAVPSSFSAARL